MRKIILILMGVFSFGVGAAQQTSTDTTRVRVYFRQGYSTLDAAFRGNGERLDAFVAHAARMREDTTLHLRLIRIGAGASPEGITSANRQLATHRAECIRSYLAERLPSCEGLFEVRSRAVDWEGLTELVASASIPYREEVLSILRSTPEWVVEQGRVVDSRKRRLGMLHGGRAWRCMEEQLFPELRRSDVEIVCEYKLPRRENTAVAPAEAESARTIPTPVSDTAATLYSALPAAVPTDCTSRRPFLMAAKTDLFCDALLLPNLGVEILFAGRWSAGATWMYGWKERNAERLIHAYGGELHLRRGFGRRSKELPLAGHHAGVYGQLLRYNIRRGERGYIADRWSCGGGVEYGYALPLGRRFLLDASVGIGYLSGICREYERQDECDVWQSTERRRWFGPTKAEIALILVLGGNARKGGRQ